MLLVYCLLKLLNTVEVVSNLNLYYFFREISIIGLFLTAIGLGAIEPCTAALGGDQFNLPEQETQLTGFFSFYYNTINAGMLVSIIVFPILRYESNKTIHFG